MEGVAVEPIGVSIGGPGTEGGLYSSRVVTVSRSGVSAAVVEAGGSGSLASVFVVIDSSAVEFFSNPQKLYTHVGHHMMNNGTYGTRNW